MYGIIICWFSYLVPGKKVDFMGPSLEAYEMCVGHYARLHHVRVFNPKNVTDNNFTCKMKPKLHNNTL